MKLLNRPTDRQPNISRLAGKLIAMSFVHGGPGPNFFSSELFDSIIEGRIINPSIGTIGDISERNAVKKIDEAETVEALREALLSKIMD